MGPFCALPIVARMLLAGLENLRAIKAACWSAGLKDHQVEQLFWGNATRLLAIR